MCSMHVLCARVSDCGDGERDCEDDAGDGTGALGDRQHGKAEVGTGGRDELQGRGELETRSGDAVSCCWPVADSKGEGTVEATAPPPVCSEYFFVSKSRLFSYNRHYSSLSAFAINDDGADTLPSASFSKFLDPPLLLAGV